MAKTTKQTGKAPDLVAQVKWGCECFDATQGGKTDEKDGKENRLATLFGKESSNNKLKAVLEKCEELNAVYKTHVTPEQVAPCIVKLAKTKDLDARLAHGDITVVEDLVDAFVINNPDQPHPYSFATKYCNFSNHDVYPICDSWVRNALTYYQKFHNFTQDFNNDDLFDYFAFNDILNDFKRFFSLEGLTAKEIDKYLWTFGKLLPKIDNWSKIRCCCSNSVAKQIAEGSIMAGTTLYLQDGTTGTISDSNQLLVRGIPYNSLSRAAAAQGVEASAANGWQLWRIGSVDGEPLKDLCQTN